MEKKRKSGVLAHVTSFPGRYGIGDLGQPAYDFVDFLEKSKQSIWQILPLGHTSFGDSPYQSFSTFAGNPLLISPEELLKEEYLKEDELRDVPLFSKTEVDYGQVILYKTKIFKKAFLKFIKNAKKKQQGEYEKFCQANKDWLDDYALFMSIKEHFIEERRNTAKSPDYDAYMKNNKGFLSENQINDCFYGAAWSSWPDDIKSFNQSAVSRWKSVLEEKIKYYKFLQFEFFRQWNALKKYANNKNISIVGDIPIYVALDSADVWSCRELFYMEPCGNPKKVAGVPPDYFSKTGQLWGNPLYDWPTHKKTGYSWWSMRIKKTLEIVDMIRIDHFRAFESYWAIPYGDTTAENGKWEKGPGAEIFDEIKKRLGEVPIIAEDLGDLNKEVLMLRDRLGFPGMKILQFAFDSPENDYLPHNYKTPNAVVYTGTHDNDTVIGWYEGTDEKIKDFYRRLLNVSGDDPAWDLIRLAHSSCADISVIPIQDLMALGREARMNTPSTGTGNWKFRYTEGMLAWPIEEGLAYLTELYNRSPARE